MDLDALSIKITHFLLVNVINKFHDSKLACVLCMSDIQFSLSDRYAFEIMMPMSFLSVSDDEDDSQLIWLPWDTVLWWQTSAF